MTQFTYTDGNGRMHDYSKYATDKLLKIWWFCPNREITEIVEKVLNKRGVEY